MGPLGVSSVTNSSLITIKDSSSFAMDHSRQPLRPSYSRIQLHCGCEIVEAHFELRRCWECALACSRQWKMTSGLPVARAKPGSLDLPGYSLSALAVLHQPRLQIRNLKRQSLAVAEVNNSCHSIYAL